MEDFLQFVRANGAIVACIESLEYMLLTGVASNIAEGETDRVEDTVV